MKTEIKRVKKSDWWPSVTIIVPCYNEEKTVTKTILSLLALSYPKDKFKILAIDDGSTDNTLQILEQFKDNSQIEVYTKENGGKYTALNFALEKTTSEMVGCLDADSFVEPETLHRIICHFEDDNVMAVTPAIVVHEPKNIIQVVQSVEYAWGIFICKMLSYLGALRVTPGPFSIFRTEVFRKLGGYKEAYHTEDLEYALRMQKNHYKIVNAHDAKVHTVVPKNVKALYKQRVRWTYGFINNSIDYKSLFFKKEYGNLGLLTLPIAVLTIFFALYSTGAFLFNFVVRMSTEFQRYQAIGLDFGAFKFFTFDWFFTNTDSIVILALIVWFLSMSIIVLSRVITEGKFRFSLDLLYFIPIYSLIVPFWLMKAIYNTILSKNISWR
jgi:cellulose synthase/poly-beta-1,6-N-acetylglucosamine synthase-like glycosyltransferase